MRCAKCGFSIKQRACLQTSGKGMKECPTIHEKELLEKALEQYLLADFKEFAKQASIQEVGCYANRDTKPYVMNPIKPRIQEICEFA